MLAILYDRIRPDEKMLFERAEALGIPFKKVYVPRASARSKSILSSGRMRS